MAEVAASPPLPSRWSVHRLLTADWPITVVFVVAAIGLWQASGSWITGVYWYATPSEIAHAFSAHFHSLLLDSRATLLRVLTGYAIGAGIGVVLGLLAGVSRLVEDAVDPVVALTYSIPKIALFPALLLLMGFTDKSRVVIVAMVAFYPAYINAHAGTRGIDVQLLKIARNLEAGRLRTFWGVVVPAALPRVVVGLRISLAISYVIVFVAEAKGGLGRGLGMTINIFVVGADFKDTYAAMLCYAVLGIASDRLLVFAGRRMTRGQELEMIGSV